MKGIYQIACILQFLAVLRKLSKVLYYVLIWIYQMLFKVCSILLELIILFKLDLLTPLECQLLVELKSLLLIEL